MNKKAIKSVLSKKFNQWVSSIKDSHVKSLVENNTIITGGCITSMLLNEDVKDFDVYFSNKETTKAVADYYVKEFLAKHPNMSVEVKEEKIETGKMLEKYNCITYKHETVPETETRVKVYIKSAGVAGEVNDTDEPVFEDVFDVLGQDNSNKFRPVYLSANAITLSDKMQLVLRFYGPAEEIHKNYDFVHATNYWTSKDNNLVLHQKALESILTKELFYMGSKYPLCSIIRTRKFVGRGWKISAGQYLKMMFQVSELNLKDMNVLSDQLVGVDSAYFDMLITALKTQSEENPEKINSSYVASIVDKIFGD